MTREYRALSTRQQNELLEKQLRDLIKQLGG
jgi:hypothetical protein